MKTLSQALLIAGLLLTGGAHAAEQPAAVKLNIAAQPISDALNEFARQSGLQVFFLASEDSKRLMSASLSGSFDPKAALKKLLSNTNLNYQYLDARTVAIVPPSSKTLSPKDLPTGASGRAGEVIYLRLAQGDAAQPAVQQDIREEGRSLEEGEITDVIVTGSRMRSADRTAPVVTIDREIIEKRGFSTVEDIIRSLPQNLATMNSARSVTQPVGGDGLPVGPAAQGEVTVNLRAIGQSATLVLVDGRRTAGSAGFGGSAVNLASIPAASVERIEVLSDSAAAVYGSDAIAGVVNIVLRKDYRGASSSMRVEDGENGGDKRAFDQVLGFGWDGGNLTATLSLSDTRPISTVATGYSSNDMRSLGGYDNRNTLFAQTGNVMGYGSLPAGYDGTEAWTAADLTQANFQAARGDWVPRDQSSDTESRAAYMSLKQTLSDRIEGSLGVRYSQDKVKALGIPPFIYASVSATNPYNRLGVPLTVGYLAEYEAEAGLIPLDYSTNTLKNLSVDAGVRIDLPVRDWRADLAAVHSVAESRSGGMSYADNFAFFNPVVGATVNVFGDGTAQNLQPFLDAYGPRIRYTDRQTKLAGLTASAEGGLAQLPAGSLRGAVGAEYRVEGLSFGAGDYLSNMNLADRTPEQTIAAVFAETHVPLFSSLSATLQGRWEQYETDTTVALVDGKTFEEFSPRVGLVWTVASGLSARASWGRSFKAPNLTSLVVVDSLGTFASALFDPIENETVPVFRDNVANPDLKPESGETMTAGVDWTASVLPGFGASLTFSRTKFDNRIVGSVLNVTGVGVQGVLANPQLFPGVAVRDPVTNTLLRIRSFPFNVAAVEVDAVDFDLHMDGETSYGGFSARLQGVYNIKNEVQGASLLPAVGVQGTTDADRLAGVLSLGWSRESYGADLYGNYIGPYWNTEITRALSSLGSIPAQHVSSRTTWDLTGYRDFNGGWRLSAGVRNLFSEKFPFHQGYAGPYDTRRVDLRGRLMHIELRKDFSF